MFDEKLKRARQLIEKRDAIDEELRALFGETAQPKRSRRAGKDNSASLDHEKEKSVALSEVQH